MVDDWRKVSPGERLRIPARVWNALLDAARGGPLDDLSGRGGARAGAGRVLVRNDSGAARERFEVLGISGVVFDPAADLLAFQNQPILIGVLPTVDHQGRFVVLSEPAAASAVVYAVGAGIAPVQIEVSDEDHACADVKLGDASRLASGSIGAAAILWKQIGTGTKWAIVRIGAGGAAPGVIFPAIFEQVGGEQGTKLVPATWTYDVRNAITNELLGSAVSPVAAPHKWQRPQVGDMITATFGYAHYQVIEGVNTLVIGWINEMPSQGPCNVFQGP